MKTLEELGYLKHDKSTSGSWSSIVFTSKKNNLDTIYLLNNGTYEINAMVSYELHKAIELAMKELGWW